LNRFHVRKKAESFTTKTASSQVKTEVKAVIRDQVSPECQGVQTQVKLFAPGLLLSPEKKLLKTIFKYFKI